MNFLFIAITLLSLVLFYLGVGRDKRVLYFSLAWIICVGAVSYSGYFENTLASPPRFIIIVIGAIGLALFWTKKMKNNKVNPHFLIAVHTIRLPVELFLYHLFLEKKVPILMTYKGYNFDILMGISAIIILLYVFISKKQLSRTFMKVWNILGIFFLLFIVIIAILSAPLPLQQLAFDQPNIALTQYPFIFLPAFIVPVVFVSHFSLLKTNITRSD